MSKKVCLPGDIMIEGKENVTCSYSSNIVETNLNVLLFLHFIQMEAHSTVVIGKMKYDASKTLSKGKFGSVVYVGEYDGRQVAVEKVKKSSCSDAVCETVRSLVHCSVVKVLHSEEDAKFRYIRMPYFLIADC
jgi:hypothetical protein